MSGSPRVAAIVPCYRECAHVAGVLAGLAREVDQVFVVDDGCPDDTGGLVERLARPDTRVIRRRENGGVGAATVTGYRAALAAGFDLLVKVDGDGQMDPTCIPALLAPLRAGWADYSKGDRLASAATMRPMPMARRVGNRLITLLARAMTGDRRMSDPMNGFTAITATALRQVALDRLDPRFFFETDLLVHLTRGGARVVHVPMVARYGAERSHLGLRHILLRFPPRIARHLLARACGTTPRPGFGWPVRFRSGPGRRRPP